MKKNTKKTTQNIGVSNKFVLPNSVTNINSSVIRKGKLKRFDKAGVYGDQIGTLIDANGNPVTGPSSQIPQSKGGMSANTAGAIGQGVATAASAIPGGDPRSAGSYAKNILGTAGTMAATGATIGGPWGAAAGAVVGAGIGTVQSISADRAEQDRLNKIAAAEREAVATQNSGMMQADYNMRNVINHRVPGLKNGIAKFNSGGTGIAGTNAMVANEEAVKDGNTGKLNVVPGNYNQSNPDQVEANLTEGTSVYSKNPAQTLPFGKSTPADIMSRAARVQKNSDEILSGKTKLSQVDKNTAKLNNANIEAQSRLLNMNTAIEHAEQGNGKYNNGKYDKGKPGVIYAKHFTDGVLGWDDGKIGTADDASRFEEMYPGYKRFKGATTVPSEYSGNRPTMASGVNRDLGAELDKLGVKDWNEKGFKIPNRVADSWYGGELNPNITGPTYKSGTRFNYDFVVGKDGSVHSTKDVMDNELPSSGPSKLNIPQPQTPALKLNMPAQVKNTGIFSKPTAKQQTSTIPTNNANTASIQAQNTASGAIIPSTRDNGLEGSKISANGNQQPTGQSNASANGMPQRPTPVTSSVQSNNPYSVVPKSDSQQVQSNTQSNINMDNYSPMTGGINRLNVSSDPTNIQIPGGLGVSTSTSSKLDRNYELNGEEQATVNSQTQNQDMSPKQTQPIVSGQQSIVPGTNKTASEIIQDKLKGVSNTINAGINSVGSAINKATSNPIVDTNPLTDQTPKYNKSSEYPKSDLWSWNGTDKSNATAADEKVINPAVTTANPVVTQKPGDTPVTQDELDKAKRALELAKTKQGQKELEDAKKAEDNGDDYKYEFKKSSNNDWASALASLAPAAYNMSRVLEGAETVNPKYARYMNIDKRYNIAPELAEQKRQRNISRYNVSASGAGNNLNAAYASDIYAKGTDQLSKTMANAELANQGYRSEYANMYNAQEQANNQERIRVNDINMRNKAKVNDFKDKIAEDISKFAQNQAIMKNQKASDVLSSRVWDAYSNATDPTVKNELLRMMSSVTGADFVKVAKNKPTINKPVAKNDKTNGGQQ